MLTLAQAIAILREHELLMEVVVDGRWHYTNQTTEVTFEKLTYDSRKVGDKTLFICKGLNFKEQYLHDAISKGAIAYLAEKHYETNKLGIIVTNIYRAMAVLAKAFYGYPNEKLKIIGFTGTKGKTTSTFMLRNILSQATGNKVAQLSSESNILDGKTAVPSSLTTPESADLYEMMAIAVENGMEYLVMEVSSQAYKLDRVYDLQFDVGIFLNISPDHISDIEHPTFDDYFYCKTLLFNNSKRVVLNKDSDYSDFLLEKLDYLQVPYLTYGYQDKSADYTFEIKSDGSFDVSTNNLELLSLDGNYELTMPGEFNVSNAVASILVASIFQVSQADVKQGLANTSVPGRMEIIRGNDGKTVYVDYAHNYLSLIEFFKFLRRQHPNGKIIVVTGSIGGKAQNRRQDMGKAISELADIAYLTSDDVKNEDPFAIIDEIADSITNPNVEIHKIINRAMAIKNAIEGAKVEDAILLAGKGPEQFLAVGNKNLAYSGDVAVAKRWLKS